jgi:hypothetical protein
MALGRGACATVATPLHREQSSTKEKGTEVRFRGVVSAERYQKFTAFLKGNSKVSTKSVDKMFWKKVFMILLRVR